MSMTEPTWVPGAPETSSVPAEPLGTLPGAPAAGLPTAYDSNRQEVANGLAVLGGTVGDIHFHQHVSDGNTEDMVIKPRFREGPYPVEEISDRLRAFVEPPTYASCREMLISRQVLLLAGEARTGTSTAAFALLRDITEGGQITGLGSATDLTEWSPSAAGGYLVEGIAPDASGLLDEVAFNRLTEQLNGAHAYLVVIIDQTAGLPRALVPWCRKHIPPGPSDVAQARLTRMTDDEALSKDQLATALAALDQAPFKEYLTATRSPAAGVEVAEELWEVVANGRTLEAAADNLRLGSAEAAARLLETVRSKVDDLALTATIALLEEQDRSVVERFAAQLQQELATRLEPSATTTDHDLLGRGIKDRLDSVQAQLLPRTVSTTRGYRYWTQPVAFRGKHLAEEVLRRLWLDYEGFSDTLMTWMLSLPYEPGVDRIAGRRIGRVLCQASGPNVLRQLREFADSSLGWQRRLAGYALGEAGQDVVLSGAVRSQLRQWSQLAATEPRCTVAETCAGSLGLALPAFALNLLHTVLAGPEARMDDKLRKAVSAALGVLLSEDANRNPVFEQLTAWLGEQSGTARHAYAIRSIEALCSDGFPAVSRAGIRRLTLADLFANGWDLLVPLVLGALDDKVLQNTMEAALIKLERSGPDGRERMDAFLTALTEASGGHHGLRVFLLARYRNLSSSVAEAGPR